MKSQVLGGSGDLGGILGGDRGTRSHRRERTPTPPREKGYARFDLLRDEPSASPYVTGATIAAAWNYCLGWRTTVPRNTLRCCRKVTLRLRRDGTWPGARAS